MVDPGKVRTLSALFVLRWMISNDEGTGLYSVSMLLYKKTRSYQLDECLAPVFEIWHIKLMLVYA